MISLDHQDLEVVQIGAGYDHRRGRLRDAVRDAGSPVSSQMTNMNRIIGEVPCFNDIGPVREHSLDLYGGNSPPLLHPVAPY